MFIGEVISMATNLPWFQFSIETHFKIWTIYRFELILALNLSLNELNISIVTLFLVWEWTWQYSCSFIIKLGYRMSIDLYSL